MFFQHRLLRFMMDFVIFTRTQHHCSCRTPASNCSCVQHIERWKLEPGEVSCRALKFTLDLASALVLIWQLLYASFQQRVCAAAASKIHVH
jgi:hypothetical protein